MNLTQQVDSLMAKHHDLDEALDIEVKRLEPDDLAIHNLKKQKLRIKDQLAEISH